MECDKICCALQTRYQCAMEHGVNVVTPDWILDCDASVARLSESSYHPSLLEYNDQTVAAASSGSLNGPSSVGEHEENFTTVENEMAEPFLSRTDEQEKSFPTTSNEETVVSSSTNVEQKSQAWNEAAASSILNGIIFHIVDYPQCVGRVTIEKWEKVIMLLIR